jgi:hypothetical protein
METPQYFGKMEGNLILKETEDNLDSLKNGGRPQFFWHMENDINWLNGKWPHVFVNGR